MKRSLLLGLMVVSSSCVFGAADPLPENGFKAEQEGRWEDAVVVYRDALRVNAQQLHIWLRLADIHAHLQQHVATADALEHATRLQPNDAALWKKLSEARAVANDKNGAYVAAGQAVELAPDNLDYLRAHAQLAVWSSNHAVAITTYRKILTLAPDDALAWLSLARVSSWGGHTDAAASQYRSYLNRRPDDKEAWLELVKVVGWRGDFPTALEYLEHYKERFGEDRGYFEQRARALAWAGKSAAAIEFAQQLLQTTPDDPEVLTTRLIAMNQANRMDEALSDLKAVAALRPESQETLALQRYVLTPLRSSVSVGLNYGHDSSDLGIQSMMLDGELVLNPHTRLIAGVQGQRLDAGLGSGLENINGGERADYRRIWGGVKHRFSPGLAGELRLGGANADGNHAFTEYRLAMDWRPSDSWTLRPEIERSLYAISPRAVSLHVERDSARLLAHWTPGTRYVVDTSLTLDRYSDGNSRWEVSLAPRRAVLRTQRLNMDIGLSGTWSGFEKNLDSGYYDPSHFQRYALTSFLYWKINDDNGVSLAVSLGSQKDDAMNDFELGGDAVVQWHLGINRDWYLRVFGSWMHNVLASSGAYRSNNVGVVLTRRF